MLNSWRRLDHVLRSVKGSWIMVRGIGSKVLKERGIDKLAMTRMAKDVFLNDPDDYIYSEYILEKSTHRDGSIYKQSPGFLNTYRITNREETRLEPMRLSEPNANCYPNKESCRWHISSGMMQIFSLKLAQIPINNNLVELYGYMAVRDVRDNMLNYIVNRSRADPMVLQQGSLIEMTGPKRGISMASHVLFEFDMRIKKGEQDEDDLQLIDGVSFFSEVGAPYRVTRSRFNGECGAVDITSAFVRNAVEATIEVDISKVQDGFNFCLRSFVFTYGLYEEIQLFHGNISESCGLRRFVVAVVMDTWMHLKFKIGRKGSKNFIERYYSFKTNNHGYTCQQVILDLASISVKVNWSMQWW